MNAEWSKLYDEHVSHVRATLHRMGIQDELDDLVQECFLKVWKSLDRFRGESSPKTWVTRIAMNTVYDHWRRKGHRGPAVAVAEDDLVHTPVGGAGVGRALYEALQALSVEHREVLVLHVLEENSVAEVAMILKIAEGTVKSRLFHARRTLERMLRRRGISP